MPKIRAAGVAQSACVLPRRSSGSSIPLDFAHLVKDDRSPRNVGPQINWPAVLALPERRPYCTLAAVKVEITMWILPF